MCQGIPVFATNDGGNGAEVKEERTAAYSDGPVAGSNSQALTCDLISGLRQDYLRGEFVIHNRSLFKVHSDKLL